MASSQQYRSERMVAGYAFDRPPVHEHIVRRFGQTFRRALDVGSGAGLSVRALEGVAATVIGLEPVPVMLKHRPANAPFVVAQAEWLPFRAGSFDLITAAGSLNYVRRELFMAEARRVLEPGGVVFVYDFGQGRSTRADSGLSAWFEAFERRYPSAPGYHFDVGTLHPSRFEEFDVVISMNYDGYLRYALTESEDAEESWCAATLSDVFPVGVAHDVIFPAYLARIETP